MDKIFKIGLLVLGFSYLAYLFCPVVNQVGRYSILERDGTYTRIMDTATGGIYYYDVHSDKWHLDVEIQWKDIKKDREAERKYQAKKAKKTPMTMQEWEKQYEEKHNDKP